MSVMLLFRDYEAGYGVKKHFGDPCARKIEHVLDGTCDYVKRPAADPGSPQLSSMKRITESWSVKELSTKFFLAYGEITRNGRRGPYPQRA